MPTTREDFQAYLARFRQPGTEGFLVCLRDGGAMAGMIALDTIVRGRFQSASISYAAFVPAAGQGTWPRACASCCGTPPGTRT